MKTRTISRRLITWLLAVSVIIILISGIQLAYLYYHSEMDRAAGETFNYARIASAIIDGDRIAKYEKTGKTDGYYEHIQDFFQASVDETDLLYYYVFVPYEDDLMYIWDADSDVAKNPLGYREEYMEDGKAAVDAIYRKDPPENILLSRDDTYGYIGSAFYPIFNSDGDPVAVVGVDLSMPNLYRDIFRFILSLLIGIILATGLSAVGLYYLIQKRVVGPLRKINLATSQIVGHLEDDSGNGPPELLAQIRSGDELQELAGSFDKMHQDLRDYVRENASITAEKERIGTELSLATRIQADMLPSIFPPFPDRYEFDIYATMSPAKEVGGDFYDFFLVDDDHLALVMADVSGKGVPAALFMMMSKIMIQNNAMMGKGPAQVLTDVNNQICPNNREEMFVTAWLGILEISTGRLRAANAGHEKPIFRTPGGDFELIRDRHGFVIGGMEGMKYQEYELQMEPGAQLFIYTDGVPEATNADRELFGLDRTLEALNVERGSTAMEILSRISDKVEDFVGNEAQFDDLTMLCFNYYGKQQDSITVEARVESLPKAISFVHDRVAPLAPAETAISQLEIAVDELFGNIANYGYPGKDGMVTISVDTDMETRKVRVTFDDEGIAFDPTARTDPDTTMSAEERGIGGMGIFIVKQTMDEMEYERKDGHNVLTVTKAV